MGDPFSIVKDLLLCSRPVELYRYMSNRNFFLTPSKLDNFPNQHIMLIAVFRTIASPTKCLRVDEHVNVKPSVDNTVLCQLDSMGP
jgi:hypothetical protein